MSDGAHCLGLSTAQWLTRAAAVAVTFGLLTGVVPAVSQPDSGRAAPVPTPTMSAAVAPNLPAIGSYSSECQVSKPTFEAKIPLKNVSRALHEKRALKVLAIGSSSTTGLGASSPRMSYTVRLENNLEGRYKNAKIQVITRGVNGEIAEDTAERLKFEVATLKPDLVIWQVGTNDALARIGHEEFADDLQSTLKWLIKNHVDVMLIDPQYVDKLAADRHYTGIVNTIGKVAKSERVMVVHRFSAMAELVQLHKNVAYVSPDRLHLSDIGYGCMAEYAARAIFAGVAEAPYAGSAVSAP